ncbi:MAG: SufE family protein [Alphaproteobacteria bacterium]|nr:SufE family protein [Alphaproteobacteria bacterium]HRI75374.1 SufE family protein [Alphaproteobacteria bacterium]
MNIDELVDNFGFLEDWEDRYAYLIDLGGNLPPMDDALKTEQSKVKGCMSQVWMILGWDGDGRLTFLADSDAQIVRGLIAVLRVLFQGRSAAEIADIDVEQTFKRLGLDQHLSPNRRNGFFSMVERVKAFTSCPQT